MVMKELKADGQNVAVTETNKREYVQLACQMKMTGSIRSQIKSFLEGFYEVIPKSLISIFNEQELELLISGLPTIDIDDLKGNTEYHKYSPSSLQVCRSLNHSLTQPLTHTLTHPLTHTLTHSHAHSPTHSHAHSLNQSLKHFR